MTKPPPQRSLLTRAASHPAPLFLVLALLFRGILDGGTCLVLAILGSWLVRAWDHEEHRDRPFSPRLGGALSLTARHFLRRSFLTQLVLLTIILGEILGLPRPGSLSLLGLLCLRALRAGGELRASFFPEAPPFPVVAKLEAMLARLVYLLAGNFVFLVIALHLVLNRLLGEGIHGINLAMVAWVIRRSRHFLVERGWKAEEALGEVLEVDESHRWLQRLSTLYLLLGLLALACLIFALRQGSPIARDPRTWQVLAFLVVSLPAAALIRRSARIAATFLAGWVICGMYLAVLTAILDGELPRSLAFWLGEFAIPAAMLWYLRSEIAGENARTRSRGDDGLPLRA